MNIEFDISPKNSGKTIRMIQEIIKFCNDNPENIAIIINPLMKNSNHIVKIIESEISNPNQITIVNDISKLRFYGTYKSLGVKIFIDDLFDMRNYMDLDKLYLFYDMYVTFQNPYDIFKLEIFRNTHTYKLIRRKNIINELLKN
jgi:thymidine kinase